MNGADDVLEGVILAAVSKSDFFNYGLEHCQVIPNRHG